MSELQSAESTFTDIDLWRNLARALHRCGRDEEALAYLKRAASTNLDRDDAVLFEIALHLIRVKRYDATIDTIETLQHNNQIQTNMLCMLARQFLQAGETEHAILTLRKFTTTKETKTLEFAFRWDPKGIADNRYLGLTGVELPIDANREIRSLVLPTTPHIRILAITLSQSGRGTAITLDRHFNRRGIAYRSEPRSHRMTFDDIGYVLPAEQFPTGDSIPIFPRENSLAWRPGSLNTNSLNTIAARGQLIEVPTGHYDRLFILCASVNSPIARRDVIRLVCDEEDIILPIKVSDWCTPLNNDYPCPLTVISESLDLLGVAWLIRNSPEIAVNQLQGALQEEPDNVSALNNLAASFRLQGKTSDAVDLRKRVLTIDPGNPTAQRNLSDLPVPQPRQFNATFLVHLVTEGVVCIPRLSCLQLRVTAIMGATMNQHMTLETDFAPAERATPEQVEKQFIAVKSSPAVQEIFNRIPHIAFVLNHERQIVYANRCLLDFLGFSENASVSGVRPGEALRCIHSSKTEGGCGTTKNCSTCGAVLAILAAQNTGEPQMRECRITREVGNSTEALDLRVWTDQLTIEESSYTVMLVIDISDEKRRRVLERVFFHDIKNTATALQGSIHFIADEPTPADKTTLSKKMRPLVDQLIREIMAQEQLLAAENNELAAHMEPVMIAPLLEGLCDYYRDLKNATSRTIELCPPEQDQITTDRTILERIISNLLKNALEASSPNDTIKVGCKRIDNNVRFWVSNPQYMMKDIQLQVFQRSFSTKGMNRGIGTYSVRLLTERYLHGQAAFSSTPADGTTFFIDLPT